MLCTIATPFGKFKYNRLPMGLKCSPDYVQEVMENIFRDVTDAEVYIDDIGAFSNSWEQHIALLHIILGKLSGSCLIVNNLKMLEIKSRRFLNKSTSHMIYRAYGRLFHKELIRYNRPVNFVQHVTSSSV